MILAYPLKFGYNTPICEVQMETAKDTRKRLSSLRSRLKDVLAQNDPELAEPLRQLSLKLELQLEPQALDETESVALADYLEQVLSRLTATKLAPVSAKPSSPARPRRT